MTRKNNRPDDAVELRRRAEEIIREKAAQSPEDLEALSPEKMREMLHELRVHQIELDMQNEELRRAQVDLEATRQRYFDLYDLAPVGYCTISEKGLILEANLTAATLLSVSRSALVKQPLTRFILSEDQDIYYRHRKQLFETGEPQACELRMVQQDGTFFWVHLAATAAQEADGESICRVVMSDITDRKRSEKERELLISELTDAMRQVKKLSGLLPICSYCKKIRDDQGYWNQIESYIHEHSEAEFSHSVCQECAKKHYPDMDIYGG
ncbi:MAG: PAS domain-containing protein [Pseudomonadota bacterium]